MDTGSILANIVSPQDLKDLSYADLHRLAADIRLRIVETVSRNGGHLASNLGVVELTIALHRVFDSPKDSIVWDVGHQCYAHKLLTGRSDAFPGLRRSGGLSGFPKRSESDHDAFNTGHASTSISASLGLLAGERLKGGTGLVVAVIGDGAMTGGLAYEALAHAGHLGIPLVVVLNDNKMSIGPNVGALSEHLSRLTMKPKYQTFRRRVDQTVKRIPKVGAFLYDTIVRLKRGIKAVFYPENLFVDLGFEYVGPIEGHDIHALEQVFADVRRLGKPVVVHVITRKGKGYEFAEHDPSAFHGVTPFSIADGIVERSGSDNFTDAFGRAIHGIGLRDERVVAVSAAMEKGTGLALFRSSFPDRFFDVGIAEEHAVTFAAGLAAKGLRPVVAIYSTFIQRSVDQVIHDVALQNLPVVIALDRSGFVGDDGETHQGLFDIALFKSVPNLALLAPASGVELRNMLEWAIAGALPCIIRYPKTSLPREAPEFSLPLVQGRGVFLRESRSSLCIAFAGGLYEQALGAAELLEREGCKADLYNLRFMKPLDEDYLLRIMDSYDLWVVVEEGLRAGGIGEKIAALAAESRTKVLHLGAPDAYFAQGSRSELLERAGLDARGIAGSVLAACSPIDRMTVLKAASH